MATERSNAVAYSSQNARVELKSSNAVAYSSQNARLENWCFALAFERYLEEGLERPNAKKEMPDNCTERSNSKLKKELDVRTPRQIRGRFLICLGLEFGSAYIYLFISFEIGT